MSESKQWIPMEPQPKNLSEGWHWVMENGTVFAQADKPEGGNCFDDEAQFECHMICECPFAIGERIPVREEWRIIKSIPHPNNRFEVTIEYRDLSTKTYFCEVSNKLLGAYPDWQPASTMPPFAVRKWETVVSVEAKRPYAISGSVLREMKFDKLHPECLASNLWGWLIEVSDEQ